MLLRASSNRGDSPCCCIREPEGIHRHRCPQSLSVLAHNDKNTLHQALSLDVWVLPPLQQPTVALIPNTCRALFDLWVTFRSEAIRFQTEASFLSCSSGKCESLYWHGESKLFDHFPYHWADGIWECYGGVIRAKLNCMKLFNGPSMINPFTWLMWYGAESNICVQYAQRC